MGVIGRREFELIMKMDDQTRKERESLNRGLGDIERTSKKASAEAKRSIIDVAKQSKQSMEGIKAVMELGGWLAMANMVGTAFMNITEEARKNSQAFKEAGASLDMVGKKIGTGLVKAMEPLAEGFKTVLIYGTAVFENFPEVAKVAFDTVGQLLQKALSWETISNTIVTMAVGIIAILGSAFSFIPKMLSSALQPMALKLSEFFQWFGQMTKNVFTMQWDKLKPPPNLVSDINPVEGMIKTGADYIGAQVGNIKTLFKGLGEPFEEILDSAGKKFLAIVKPSIDGMNGDISARQSGSSSLDSGPASRYSTLPLEAQQGLLLYEASIEGLKRQNEAIQAAKEAQLALKAQAQAVAEAEKARRDQYKAMQEKLSQDNLAGKNGLGAGIGQVVADSQVGQLAAGADPITMVIAMILKAVSSLQNLVAWLQPLTTIFEAMMEVLGPLINNLLAPLVGILKIVGYVIGKTLAPALEVLRPIIGFIADLFVLLYNVVIKPIANAIILVFNLLYNAVAGMMNGIIWLINTALGWAGVHLNYVDYKALDSGALTDINTSDVNKAGSTGAGGSASYAAGTSITIEKIEIKADFIAGDAGLQQVAVMLRDELREAERAGR